MMVMGLFAVFWLSFGLLQLPSLGLAAAYSATGNAAEGAASKEYNAVVGYVPNIESTMTTSLPHAYADARSAFT